MTKKRMNIYSIQDQMDKYGISEEEAIEKIKGIKDVNVFSVDWQMKKFKISKEEALSKIGSIKDKLRESQNNMTEFDFNSMIPSKKEHWIKKGFSEEESERLILENIKSATKNCNDFIKRVKESPEEYKDIMTTQIGFYLKQGYSEIEAKKILNKRQSTFSYAKCVEKHGKDVGHKIWKERQEKWYQKTKDKLSKGDYLKYESILLEFDGDKETTDRVFVERVSNVAKSKFNKASKASLVIFNQLMGICEKNKLQFKCGVDENSEYLIFCINNKKIYFYDFTIKDLKLIFEFQGKKFHSKFENSGINEIGIDLTNKFIIDKEKKKLAEKNGFEVVYLWEEDGFEYNIEKSVSILKERISTQKIMMLQNHVTS